MVKQGDRTRDAWAGSTHGTNHGVKGSENDIEAAQGESSERGWGWGAGRTQRLAEKLPAIAAIGRLRDDISVSFFLLSS